jgi:hypothetical protein
VLKVLKGQLVVQDFQVVLGHKEHKVLKVR